MSRAANFLAWVMEDVNCISAEPDTPRDNELKEFVTQGFLAVASPCSGDNFYVITSKWMQDIS